MNIANSEAAKIGGGLTRDRVLDRWYRKKREKIAVLKLQAQTHERALIIDVRAKAAWAKFCGPSEKISYGKFEEIIWELMQQGVVG